MIRKIRPANHSNRVRNKHNSAESFYIYGIHAVNAALNNPNRKIIKLITSENARTKLVNVDRVSNFEIIKHPTSLDRLLPRDAVHQGTAAIVVSLPEVELTELTGQGAITIVDQVNDPHNIGAIMRTTLAFGGQALVTTRRNSPRETGVLAKAASGALDLIPMIRVGNLTQSLREIASMGYSIVGLDAKAKQNLGDCSLSGKIALVLGAEGKGLRHTTRKECQHLVRIPTGDMLTSLNVSNAAAVALYHFASFQTEPDSQIS